MPHFNPWNYGFWGSEECVSCGASLAVAAGGFTRGATGHRRTYNFVINAQHCPRGGNVRVRTFLANLIITLSSAALSRVTFQEEKVRTPDGSWKAYLYFIQTPDRRKGGNMGTVFNMSPLDIRACHAGALVAQT